MANQKIKKKGYQNINIAAFVACFAVILIIAVVLCFDLIFDKKEPSSDLSSETGGSIMDDSSIISDESSTSPEESSQVDALRFEKLVLDSAAIHRGELITVNGSNPYSFEPALELVNVSEKKVAGMFKMGDTDITVSALIMPAINTMLTDLYSHTSSNAFTIASGFKTFAEQEKIYNSAKDKSKASAAGTSDLHTGLSFSAWIYPSSEGTVGTGKFAWLNENCMDYGFIVRYPSNKSSITGLDTSSAKYATYRYVGLPHAYLITLNDYCLEEYVGFVTRFDHKNRYSVTYKDKEYQIYYCPAAIGSTEIYVPSDYSYTVSGDNIGGFIITITME